MRYPLIMLLALGLFSIGCDSGGGSGVAAPEDTRGGEDTPVGAVEIEPGASWGVVQASTGEAPVVRDLGALGARFEYTEAGVAGMLTGTGDDATVLSVERASVTEVSAGDPREAVTAALGDPVEDLFIDGWWYPDAGLLVEFEDDAVARIHTFTPAQ